MTQRYLLLAPVVALVACVDAPAESTRLDLSCTAAQPRIARTTASGRFVGALGGEPIRGANVDIQAADGRFGTALTDDGGWYETSLTDGVQAATAGATVRQITQGTLHGITFDPITVDPQTHQVIELDVAYELAGITRDPKKGTLLLSIEDCAGAPVADASFTGVDGVVFVRDGLALAPNVPTGPVDLTITVQGIAYAPATIGSVAGELVTTTRRP